MRFRSCATALAAASLTLGVFATPAFAGAVSITASPTTIKPGESTTVSGTSDCTDDGVAVTLTYTKPDGATGSVTANTTTDSSGAFSAQVTLPGNAVAGEDSEVHAVIADCTATSPPTTESSNSVKITVAAYAGTLKTDKRGGRPGDTVHVSGTNCHGGDVVVAFTNGDDLGEEVDVTLASDMTFAGDYVIPDWPSGEYVFAAQCPGSDFPVRAFTLVNPKPVTTPPVAKPPRGIRGTVRFTG